MYLVVHCQNPILHTDNIEIPCVFFTYPQTPQSSGVRTFLRGKYAAIKLFQAHELYTPKTQLDIGLNPGDLVGVIQKKDPMGNTDRWFVDNGVNQGFVPSRVLNEIDGFKDMGEPAQALPVTTATAEVGKALFKLPNKQDCSMSPCTYFRC